MDLGHFILGSLALIGILIALLHRNRKRSIHFRFDWDSEESFREEDEHPS